MGTKGGGVVYGQMEKETYKKSYKCEGKKKKNVNEASQGNWGLVTEKVNHQSGNHPRCTESS